MGSSSLFIDRLGTDLRNAYGVHAARRRKRRIVVGVVVLALGAATTASAVTGVFDGFFIAQGQQANIVGAPPHQLACGAAGCIRINQETAITPDGRWLYELSHRLGDSLPTSGTLYESLTKQAVFSNGETLSPLPARRSPTPVRQSTEITSTARHSRRLGAFLVGRLSTSYRQASTRDTLGARASRSADR